MIKGVKLITAENWLEPDPVSFLLSNSIDSNGHFSRMNGEDWASVILSPKLNDSVPEQVEKLFEVARGTMVYAYFFYPLFTLGCEQLYRVAETAASEKCKMLGAPKKVKTFDDKIKYLSSVGIISNQDLSSWDRFRHLRNQSSHPEQQIIYTPGMAIPMIENIAEKINNLFI